MWDTGFVVWTIGFTLVCRFFGECRDDNRNSRKAESKRFFLSLLGVYGLTFIANRRRIRKVNLQEQFIMAYGGLRGAVGFSLVEMINPVIIPPKQMFVTTT